MSEASKKKVYVETTVISYLTARPTRDLVNLARQVETREWWESALQDFELYTSPVVEREALDGDAQAAQKRMSVIRQYTQALPLPVHATALAERLLSETAVPRTSYDDALHIATAAINKMDFLVSWNCKHIARADKKNLIRKACAEAGYVCPEICTPTELKGGAE